MMHRRLVSGTWEGDTVRRIQDPDRASGPPEKTRVPVTLLYHSHILALHAYIIVLMGPNVIQRPPEETIMNRRIAIVVALVVVAVALAGVIGTTAYRAGLARGSADAGSVPGPWLYHGPFWYPGPFAFLFPSSGCSSSSQWCVDFSGAAGVLVAAAHGKAESHRCSRIGIAGHTSPRRQATPSADINALANGPTGWKCDSGLASTAASPSTRPTRTAIGTSPPASARGVTPAPNVSSSCPSSAPRA